MCVVHESKQVFARRILHGGNFVMVDLKKIAPDAHQARV